MKPDWKDAPDWAQYLAMDEDCSWYWYEFKPTLSRLLWSPGKGLVMSAGDRTLDFADTLEARPEGQ